MLIRDDGDRLARLIDFTARAMSLDPALIEKDYWAVETLRAARDGIEVAVNDVAVHLIPVFKGGTSLSKAFGLVQRFSEDVDLLVPLPVQSPTDYSNNQRAEILKAITTEIGSRLRIEGERRGGRRGVDHHWKYPYPAQFGDDATRTTLPQVVVELTVMGGSQPSSVRTITSYAADRAGELDGLAAYGDLEPVDVVTLAPERTLVEKLAMLHNAATQALDGDPRRLQLAGRHYYDIAMLLRSPDVLAALNADWVATTAADTDAWSEHGKYPFTPRPADGFAESPAFTDQSMTALVRPSYAIAADWVWGDRPTLDECVALIRDNRGRL